MTDRRSRPVIVYDTSPLPKSGFGTWFHALIPDGYDRIYGKPPTDLVELRWSADGSWENTYAVGEFVTMVEARIAMDVVDRLLASGECADLHLCMARNGFAVDDEPGLRATRPPWIRRLSEENLAVFGTLDEDLSITTPTGDMARIGLLRLPHAMAKRIRNAAVVHREALLAILKARSDAGDPLRALTHDAEIGGV